MTASLLSALRGFVNACGGNPPDWLRKEYAAAENAIAEATRRPAGAPAIKPLEWKYSVGAGAWEAYSILGVFRVADGFWQVADRGRVPCRDDETGKAAAQAYYEARIRSALADPVSGPIEVPATSAVDYLLEAVEVHAEKFPVPSHMRSLVKRIRDARGTERRARHG
ncbi:hypothetical protein [Mesorhizobium sp. M2A.F.Ca.ET.039.01.1.1]|uniref:hypothetical protein n=1 Tax=Mesorhizobium sp. M2A.F.Ca.ET.039.01.1.1 TaxID=2496746 RepID=UPI000FCC6B2C|nr:hypothetical protein [Mesorhizobium sp. M2A.F.Ca.ET.039.01.1.1]RWX72559.1 hypothetical protein EOA24_00785 [Mesorhizobium sp. M2A.F.Ca.ET.039.01.1.1]